jgi:hypothetical protein
MYAAQQSPSRIAPFPASEIVTLGSAPTRTTYVRGLEGIMECCFNESKLPRELGIPWASPGRTVRVHGLENYEVLSGD